MPAQLLTSSPGAAAVRQPLGPGSRAARVGGSASRHYPEGLARHLARLRRDLNNRHLPPAVRAGRLRRRFLRVSRRLFLPWLAVYMRDQQAALRRWTQELYGVQPATPTAGRPT